LWQYFHTLVGEVQFPNDFQCISVAHFSLKNLRNAISMTVPLQVSITPEYETDFFRSLKRELHITSDERVKKTIYLILKVVRKSLNHSQTAQIIKAFPGVLQLIFVGSWGLNEPRKSIFHLDELVELVYLEDNMQQNRLFSTEVEALRSTLIVVKHLKLILDKLGINIFPYSVLREYQQAVQHDTA